jgi:hypothetical protein
MGQSTRWMLTVSIDVNRRLRRFLADTGRKGDLSRFVEGAVKSRLLELSMKSVPTYSRPSANYVERPAVEDSIEQMGDGSYWGIALAWY